MYIITNRRIDEKDKTLSTFGKRPSEQGPNELRILNLKKNNAGEYSVTTKKDKLSTTKVKALKSRFNLTIDESIDHYASLEVAAEIFELARKTNRSILIFVHGYNNDVADVIRTAEDLESHYNAIVVPYTWPANGGGPVGTLSYLGDKSDARASVGAFNRVINKVHELHGLFTAGMTEKLEQKAIRKHPKNRSAAYEYLGELLSKNCKTKINLLCHSMGNYLLKHSLYPSENATSKLVFDNICLVAADTNSYDHQSWMEKLQFRNRLYVVINEKDYALAASQIKPGKEQRARLGHCLRYLKSNNAHYVDVTHEKGVEKKHSYFIGKAIEENQYLSKFFRTILNGDTAEAQTKYYDDLSCYRLTED